MKKANLFGILFVVICAVGTLVAMRMCDAQHPVGRSAPIETHATGEYGENREHSHPVRGSMAGLLITIAVFGVADIGFFLWAKRSIDHVCCNQKASNTQKLKSMENEEVLFDLPLYLGLGGTVLGFLMIANGLSLSRDVAYVSTVLGIVSSAAMRVFLLRPRRAELIAGSDKGQE